MISPDARAGVSGIAASVALIGVAAGEAFAFKWLVGDGPQGDWAAAGLTLGVIAVIGLNAWLWFRLFRWFDILLGGNGR